MLTALVRRRKSQMTQNQAPRGVEDNAFFADEWQCVILELLVNLAGKENNTLFWP